MLFINQKQYWKVTFHIVPFFFFFFGIGVTCARLVRKQTPSHFYVGALGLWSLMGKTKVPKTTWHFHRRTAESFGECLCNFLYSEACPNFLY